jgi:hypothetical protein
VGIPEMNKNGAKGKTFLHTVRNGHGNFDLIRNLPRTGCVIVSKTWKKKFRKSIGIFIINDTEILPYVKISHENKIFLVKLPCKIYHANDPFLENLP